MGTAHSVIPLFIVTWQHKSVGHMDLHTSKLVVATHNEGKKRELIRLLDGSSFTVLSLADLGVNDEVDETGTTFDENARLKAAAYSSFAGNGLVLADDSGLEVDILDRRPGVLSARYGGDVSFGEKMAKLLAEIEEAGGRDRRARFVCSMAVADETGNIVVSSTGICEGTIALEPRGEGGFGYDPIFMPDGYDLTFGELSVDVKQKISHRAMAFKQIIPFLRDYNAV